LHSVDRARIMTAVPDVAFQRCIHPDCQSTYGIDEVLFACRKCDSLLDVAYNWDLCEIPRAMKFFEARWSTPGRSAKARADYSGVWRFRELLAFAPVERLVTIGEGRTALQQADLLAAAIGLKPQNLFLQYEGFNPSGSFKDNGMAAAFTMARRIGSTRVACASTGNTSASMALYARHAAAQSDGIPMQAVVFVGGDKIAYGKLAQALDHGATTIQIEGDFDACMKLVQQAAAQFGLYLMNSVNPFRLEGQKSIMYRVLEGLDWEPPDWIVVPGGNLGNSSAFGKAFSELRELGLVQRIPRLAIINASGANALFELTAGGLEYAGGRFDRQRVGDYFAGWASSGRKAKTIASAIEIGRPVNLPKALRALHTMNGVVREVSDEQILDGKALVGAHGFGCEPASGASVAGLEVLLRERVIAPSDRVVCILTGHGLKDADATIRYHEGADKNLSGTRFSNPPVRCSANLEAIAEILKTA
jgi:threonine synthase